MLFMVRKSSGAFGWETVASNLLESSRITEVRKKGQGCNTLSEGSSSHVMLRRNQRNDVSPQSKMFRRSENVFAAIKRDVSQRMQFSLCLVKIHVKQMIACNRLEGNSASHFNKVQMNKRPALFEVLTVSRLQHNSLALFKASTGL